MKTQIMEFEVMSKNLLFRNIHGFLVNRINLRARTCFFVLALAGYFQITHSAFAHGFNANHVNIIRTTNGKYRIVIRYTHIEVGEYREAHIDFTNREEALKVYWDLAKGADFFLGNDAKNIVHFHTEPPKNNPY